MIELSNLLVVASGLVAGSFINVLSLRILEGRSLIWPPSSCPKCQHRLSALDNIPLLSFLLLKGCCRYCKDTISWQYPLVELITALLFLLCFHTFGLTVYGLGIAFFGSTMIAVSITDFKEKVIPHDITYPSLLTGLVFSTWIRHDLLGTLAGIGMSYIFFDFLAHYGMKIYLAVHRQNNLKTPDTFEEAIELSENEEKLSAIEVIGGGDAVLAAVIASWLGWQKLVLAVGIGFLIGTVMGMIYLIKEMHQANILKNSARPVLMGAILGIVCVVMPLYILSFLSNIPFHQLPVITAGLVGLAGGGALSLVLAGSSVSRPYPFGPALAAGGLIAAFLNPLYFWLNGA